jgi:hypothetical protein
MQQEKGNEKENTPAAWVESVSKLLQAIRTAECMEK